MTSEAPRFAGSSITDDQFGAFLVRAYMGAARSESSEQLWTPQLRRAYRDVCRTLHGVGTASSDRVSRGVEYLRAQIIQLQSSPTSSRPDFDLWHESVMDGLVQTVGSWEFRGQCSRMTVGQAQKWLNMTLKYIYVEAVVSNKDVGPLATVYQFAHMPLDKNTLTGLARGGCVLAGRWSAGWSGMGLNEYRAIRDWILESEGPDVAMLDLDFRYW